MDMVESVNVLGEFCRQWLTREYSEKLLALEPIKFVTSDKKYTFLMKVKRIINVEDGVLDFAYGIIDEYKREVTFEYTSMYAVYSEIATTVLNNSQAMIIEFNNQRYVVVKEYDIVSIVSVQEAIDHGELTFNSIPNDIIFTLVTPVDKEEFVKKMQAQSTFIGTIKNDLSE